MSRGCDLPGCLIPHSTPLSPNVRVRDVVTTDVQPDQTYQTIITYEILRQGEDEDVEEERDSSGD